MDVIGINCIYKQAQTISNHQLDEHTPQEELQALLALFVIELVCHLYLWQQLIGRTDRTRGNLKKKGNEQYVVKNVLFCFSLPMINI